MQTENIHIRNGRLIDPKNGIDRQADVFVAAGTICGIGEKPAGFDAARVIDASDRVVCPGLVDLSARLPSLDTDLVAAVSGGLVLIAWVLALSMRRVPLAPARPYDAPLP